MNNIIAYGAIEQDFIGDHKFNIDEYQFFSSREDAKESVEDYIDEEIFYLMEVEITGNLFDIYNPTHRSILLKHLPSKVSLKSQKMHKELFVMFLMGLWNKDYSSLDDEEMKTTEDFFDDVEFKFTLRDLGFDGFIAMKDSLATYTVFKPDTNVEILRIFL
jgi:hypothetical protein